MTEHNDDRTDADPVTLFNRAIESIRCETTSLLVETLTHLEEIGTASPGHTS